MWLFSKNISIYVPSKIISCFDIYLTLRNFLILGIFLIVIFICLFIICCYLFLAADITWDTKDVLENTLNIINLENSKNIAVSEIDPCNKITNKIYYDNLAISVPKVNNYPANFNSSFTNKEDLTLFKNKVFWSEIYRLSAYQNKCINLHNELNSIITELIAEYRQINK